MRNFLLLLDGPKGAGKSTIAALLTETLKDTDFFSLDATRRGLPGAKATTEWNQIAFQIILDQATEALSRKRNAVIDCGVTKERFGELKKLSQKLSVPLRAYSLIAPFDVLLTRVKERDKENGKFTDESRLKHVYDALQLKAFDEFIVLNTGDTAPNEIINMIISDLCQFRKEEGLVMETDEIRSKR